MDEEIKKLIEDYVRKIESKEADLVFLRREIDGILAEGEKKVREAQAQLDAKFDADSLSEEEYLKQFREAKENILRETKAKLDALVQGTDQTSHAREDKENAHEDKLGDLRKQLGLPD